jgi:hypothetical protein
MTEFKNGGFFTVFTIACLNYLPPVEMLNISFAELFEVAVH